MIKEYQVTLVCASGKYKPVSCIIKKDSKEVLTKCWESTDRAAYLLIGKLGKVILLGGAICTEDEQISVVWG